MSAARTRADVVETLLRERADRGVFWTFAAVRRRGQLDCSVAWLKERPTRIVFKPSRNKLWFPRLLPNLPRQEPLYKDFRAFLKGRAAKDLPNHRRIDADRVRVTAVNRLGEVSVGLESLDGDLDYLVAKGIKLVNEIFMGFLRGPYHEYMVANFQEPED